MFVCVSVPTNQSAGDPHHNYWSCCSLTDIEQVVQERLVLVVSEQIKFLQNKDNALLLFASLGGREEGREGGKGRDGEREGGMEGGRDGRREGRREGGREGGRER